MQLPLLVKLGKIRHRQRRRVERRGGAPKQGRLQADLRPNPPKRPSDLALPLTASTRETVPWPIEQLGTICLIPRPTSNLNRRISLVLRTDNLLAGKLILPFLERLPAIVLSSAVGPVEINPAKPNAVPGSAQNCSASSRIRYSPSSRITVRDHPGIAFTFPRNP